MMDLSLRRANILARGALIVAITDIFVSGTGILPLLAIPLVDETVLTLEERIILGIYIFTCCFAIILILGVGKKRPSFVRMWYLVNLILNIFAMAVTLLTALLRYPKNVSFTMENYLVFHLFEIWLVREYYLEMLLWFRTVQRTYVTTAI